MASQGAPARKLPTLEPETAFFWTSGADGRLRIQRCAECRTWQHPPLPRCATCGSEAMAAEPTSGKGSIASYTINHEAWLPGLPVPFVLAAVELAEQAGLYVMANLDGAVTRARIGLPVTVRFEQHEDVWLPFFAPKVEA
ncbi:OB-fold domain-containing protein [Novosphingobium sp. BL-8H]|uniref:Zn-ribbon domain-containing OB-fold protein n=1 Tax=Novosphingobium sp. BL-8H TaxID=3127640 RepID=UPI003757A14F